MHRDVRRLSVKRSKQCRGITQKSSEGRLWKASKLFQVFAPFLWLSDRLLPNQRCKTLTVYHRQVSDHGIIGGRDYKIRRRFSQWRRKPRQCLTLSRSLREEKHAPPDVRGNYERASKVVDNFRPAGRVSCPFLPGMENAASRLPAPQGPDRTLHSSSPQVQRSQIVEQVHNVCGPTMMSR